MDYILYGDVRDKSLRAITEYYISLSGGSFLFYVDDSSDRAKQPDEILCFPEATVVIMCTAVKKVERRLREKGIKNKVVAAPLLGYRFIMDPVRDPDSYRKSAPTWFSEKESELRRIYCLDDKETKELFNEISDQREEFHFIETEKFENLDQTDYFSDKKVSPQGSFLFVDGGTYDGDTIEAIHERYGDRAAFFIGYEPDEDNFTRARTRIDELGISKKCCLIRKGLHNQEGYLKFKLVEDELSVDDDGDITVEVEKLDSKYFWIKDKISGLGDCDLCIKMDLEGSEEYAVKGAERVIREFHPFMAICLYHKMEDILKIPRAILNIRGDYKFYLRAGTHTEVYAVPEIQNK